jgi:hypothetical protein
MQQTGAAEYKSAMVMPSRSHVIFSFPPVCEFGVE